MKANFRILIILIGLLLCDLNLSAQQITLNLSKTPLKTVLKAIEKQCDFTFVYSNALNGINDRVTINTNKEPLENVLRTLLGTKNIVYKITEKQIALTPRELVPNETAVNQVIPEVQIESRHTVKGVIIEKDTGEPVPFASIFIKENKSIGAITDTRGAYSIQPESGNQTLVVSYIGFKTEEIAINNRAIIDIQLTAESTNLEEVMVVAYGSTTKGSFTGSAGKIDSKKLELRPVTTITNTLSGVTPGVMLNSANGQPGSDASIRIRGIGSINASNDPLIILDGMPYSGVISNINPSDIESLTILKDASSSALYGSRAANGVVVITTKKGVSEKTQISFKLANGFTSSEMSDYSRVGIEDYMELYWENLKNKALRGGMNDEQARFQASNNLISQLSYNPYNVEPTEVVDINGKLNSNAKLLWSDDLDWEKAIKQQGYTQDYALSINGRNEKTDYYASFGYTNERGFIIGSDFERYSARTNINSKLNNWFKTGINLGANISSVAGMQDEGMGNLSNPFLFTRYIGPIYPVHIHNPNDGSYVLDEDGNRRYDFGIGYTLEDGTIVPKRDFASGTNPAIELQNRIDKLNRQMISAKPYIEISFLKGFKFTINAAVTSNAYRSASASVVYPDKGNTATSTKSNSFTTTWTVNQLLTWNKTYGKHTVDILFGHESYSYEYNYLSASLRDQIFSDNYELANYVNINSQPNSYSQKYRTEGYLSRINYSYADKYILSASFRRDGSSRFYKDARWGNFWSLGGAWRLEQEDFIKQFKFIDELKLRASFGQVGNDDIGSYYPWQALYTKSQNANEPGYVQSSLGNKNLKWEVNRSYDAALEFGMFNFFRGSVEYFFRKSSNLLFSVPLSPASGIASQDLNSGSMSNSGLEFQLGFDILKRDNIKWNVDINGAMLKNNISSLPIDPYNINSGYQRVEEGHSRYEWWLLQWAGVNPENGDCLYIPNESATNLITVNGKSYTSDINQAKEDWSGSSIPKIYGGIQSGFTYKNFNVSVLLSYQLGGKMYDFTYYNLMSPNNRSNQSLHQDILERWNTPGQETNVPRLDDGNPALSLKAQRSTRWLVSSDMLELKNVSISYTIPNKFTNKLGVSNLRIYASSDNVFVFNKRTGMNSNYNLNGYDNNGDRYSPSRTVIIGINFNL
ncbi:MAG: SusC/RagA family TonB-linked outer membrane protein [Rikenellaceae bacterium]